MAKKNLKVGVIGVGSMGKNHTRIYSEIPNVDLIGVSDLSDKASRDIAAKFNCKSFPDYRHLLKEVDAVSIASPTLTHYEIALECISSNVHLLIEKPFTSKSEEAQDILTRAKAAGLAAQVGFVDRYNHAVTKMRQLVADKNILSIEIRRLSPPIQRASDVGVVFDLMIHDIEHVIDFAKSKPVKINAAGNYTYAVAIIKFENGITASIIDSKATYDKVRQLNISCQDSYYSADMFKNEIKKSEITPASAGKQYVDFSDLTTNIEHCSGPEPLKDQLQDFVDIVLSADKQKFYNKDIIEILNIATEVENKCLRQ